ncbi:Trm112 family protein [Algoriphagus terrigena]|uniref:Trm112 family protein n=1 Tax=Algoriphagus terrigena TaxID=344884 RepID=UPI000429DD1C|nr:Trm112 family protein [Algoriphagus terrigena]
MNRKLLDRLCCPFDKSDLQVQIFHETEDHEIIEGLLSCPSCERYFPIIYGIPIMTPDQYREKSLELPSLKRWGLELDAESGSFRLEKPISPKELEG